MDVSPTTIVEERPEHAAAVRAVVAAAFGRADEADLVDRLRADGDAVIALVAVEDGTIVGHVLSSRLTAPFRALGLGPVAVAPGRQRVGIGARRIRAGLARAARNGWQGMFVVGEPMFYRRFGFDADLAEGFESPCAGPCLMALALAAALPARTGRIAYAPAFARLEERGA